MITSLFVCFLRVAQNMMNQAPLNAGLVVSQSFFFFFSETFSLNEIIAPSRLISIVEMCNPSTNSKDCLAVISLFLFCREQGTVRQLLNNCITLIDNDRFPEVTEFSCYLQ